MKNCKRLTITWFRLLPAICCLLIVFSTLHAQAPDRSKPPALGPSSALKLPVIQRFKLSNGLPVVVMEKRGVPLVQIDLLVKAGTAMDPAGKNGLASMVAAMLDEGAGSRNALQLADAIDFLGANLSTAAGRHTSAITLNMPLSKLDSALVLMADVALRPAFAPEELNRQRKQRLTTLAQWHDQPETIASVIFNRTLYGEKHPYGLPAIGDEKSLRNFRVEELKNFYSTYLRPNNATLIVVGDVTPSAILPKIEAAFGKWEAGKIPTATWPGVAQVRKRQVWLVDKPGAEQSEIRLGRLGVPRLTEDYYALVVMNTILGGSFTSRLNQNLRETHGYSYGAYSYFDFRPLPGPFLAEAAVQTSKTDSALIEFMKELNAILRPVSDGELTRGKNYVALSFPQDFQSVGQIANQLAELVIYDLPDDYFNNYVQRLLAVTKGDVERVAKKYLDPEKVAVIVVGDRAKIEKGVRALNLGPVQVMTVEQVLGKAPVVEGTD